MRQTRILVADDEAVNRRMLREILQGMGHAVFEAADGEAALECAVRESPDVILLDVLMPKLDGYGVCAKLKGDLRTKLIPVVMLTALDQFPDRLRAIEQGVDEFLTKPFNVVELKAQVRTLAALKMYTDELESASEVLEAIAEVVENRDTYTAGHSRRLGAYGVRVGQALGLGDGDLRILRLGGIFHDLGKIAVPDGILNKPGRLTPEEFDVVKSHPCVGAELCSRMKSLKDVIPLIRHHHEKLDGSGYPDGLKGEQIPLLVRIISVVDVYDALVTKRSYKGAFSPAASLAILREEAGKGWWDREIVETLARVVGVGGYSKGILAQGAPQACLSAGGA